MTVLEIPCESQRSFAIEKKSLDENGVSIEIAFSSDVPYSRAFGDEVLDHNPQSVRLDRLNGGAAVLVNHDVDDQVGVVESARIDKDQKGRAVIRFSRSVRGREIQQDVLDGIRQQVSVGYRIHKYETFERDGQSDLVRVTDWEPFEVSIVSVPADPTVGVGRSHSTFLEENTMTDDVKNDTVEAKAEPSVESRVDAQMQRIQNENARRIDAIKELSDQYRTQDLANQAIEENWDVELFNQRSLEEIGRRNNDVKAKASTDGNVDLSSKEQQRFSLFRLMEALASPGDRKSQENAAFELDVCSAAVRSFGPDFQPRGEFIPESALTGHRTLTAGTATDGAELVEADLLAGSFVDVLRNSMYCTAAGVRMMSGLVGTVEIPRQTSGAAASWISAEDGDATESEPQFDQITMSPKDLAVFTEAGRRLRQQSTPDIEGLIRADLAEGMALGLDKAILYGSGASGQPTGIVNQAGINTLDLAAANPTFAELVKMVRLIMDDNAYVRSLSWMLSPAGWEALMTTPRQGSGVEGNFILGNESTTLLGHRFFATNQMTTEEYILGDFRQAMVGEWGGLEMMVDPYTHSLKGRTRYVVFKTVDVAVRQPTAFCHAHDGIVV